tara:strand:+ start:327 stop:722 length:396 start_codon:yes stop_codon:yes gene_type:complete
MAKRKTKRKKAKPVPTKRKTHLYPVCFCVNENKVIAVSHYRLKMKGDRFGNQILKDGKVNLKHWQDSVDFNEGAEIDFTQYEDGDIVLCPLCSHQVDFRVYPSSTTPTITKATDETDKQGYLPKHPKTPKA